MKPIGIIANPSSGKDIRRMVAFGSVFDNHEKVNIVRRVILGLEAMGVEEVLFMPDHFRIGPRAMEDLDVSLKTGFLDVPLEGTQDDSTRAAKALRDLDVACIITLGGDGTNRAVAKTCGDIPLLPISTGTNNVFPFMVESTMAGMAAGVIASNETPLDQCTRKTPRLVISDHSGPRDIALVDAVVSSHGFIGSRAVWDVSLLDEIFLTRAEPGNIGFSSIGGHLCPLAPDSMKGVHIRIGPGGETVKAPIAPGLVRDVPVKSHRIIEPGREIAISHTPAVLALDGEREHIIAKGSQWTVSLQLDGPLVVDIPQTLKTAAMKSLFMAT
ncbi:MAG: ATP-NAD kinase [Deltaproteobacteria bacterium]|nr:ATP-NAD kinase [Deltaproteobacteria bacterium]